MDKLYGTHAANTINEMEGLSLAFDDFNENTSFDKVQVNVTQFAQQSVKAIGELKKARDEEVEDSKAANLERETEQLLISGLNSENESSKELIMGQDAAYEEQGQQYYDNTQAEEQL